MSSHNRYLWLTVGLVAGIVVSSLFLGHTARVYAGNDRHEDYIICTGAVFVSPRSQTDGVWLLDYRSGKLLGTVIDRTVGKILGWAELDLAAEFNIPPRKDSAHFLMTTGNITWGQAAVYIAETSTGKMGVYSLGPRPDGAPGLVIRRHDMVPFRQPPQAAARANG